jgi:DNA-binding transcriptional ArsR family regulator
MAVATTGTKTGTNKGRSPTKAGAAPAKGRMDRAAAGAEGRQVARSGTAAKAKPLPGMPKAAEFRSLANTWKQLGDVTRLSAIWILGNQGETNVSDLCVITGQAQTAMSHHLALLRTGGIVENRREGKSNYYSLTEYGQEFWHIVERRFTAA